MTRKSLIALVCTAILAVVITGCAHSRYDKTAIGAGIGAIAGAVIGHQLGDGDDGNVAIGAVLGALAGGAVGRYMDNQEYEMRQRLKAARAAEILNVSRLPSGALLIGIASDATFAVDSANLSAKAKVTFSKIASVLKDYKKTAIHVVGFTSAPGSFEYNMKLSRRRANAVAHFLIKRGVSPRRVLTWARGETQPIATNATAAGRAKNRRVAIVIKPIIRGRAQAAFAPPPPLGRR